MQQNERSEDRKLGKASPSTLKTLSHTFPITIADRLRDFAFQRRLSESVVLEHALRRFLESDTEEKLAEELRAAGCGLRRKTG